MHFTNAVSTKDISDCKNKLNLFTYNLARFNMTHKLVLLRHGQSVYNLSKRFTGWTDVGLSPQGKEEAKAAGSFLCQEGYTFDMAFTSLLKRAIKTLWFVLEEMDLEWIPVYKSWCLNERHYGALQGESKPEMVAKYGEDQVQLWRRDYNMAPPPLEWDDPRHPRFDRRYASLPQESLPGEESLENVVGRLLPYWESTIAPEIRSCRKVLIVSHGNTLRALVKHLDQISDRDIFQVNIPTGVPLVYELDEELCPMTSYYLGDQEKIREAIEAVVHQGKAEQK
jgi:2,3-bisphosphoglycerate-dependent phosphoglycerate mutase